MPALAILSYMVFLIAIGLDLRASCTHLLPQNRPALKARRARHHREVYTTAVQIKKVGVGEGDGLTVMRWDVSIPSSTL